jgi:glycosyltransferase involved in cell wall biosynthesis
LNLPNVFAISCNRYFAEHLSALTGVSISRFFVLYCGVDLDLFKPNLAKRMANGEKIFLQVSSLSPKKGHEYTLRAFAALYSRYLKEHYRLIITGDGERKKMLEELAESLGVRQKVEFAGTVTPNEVVALMSRAHVFVHHSITTDNGDMEGIPNSLIEAMAMELPVISTWHSGIPELVEDKVNGYLVQEKDIEAYTESMEFALAWNQTTLNRQRIAEKFNLDFHNKILETYYVSLCSC